MFLHNGFKFDRFGDELLVSDVDVDSKIAQLKVEFTLGAKAMFDQIKKLNEDSGVMLSNRITAIENIGALYTVTNSYFSTKGRRIVSVAKGKDKSDVPNMEQLNEVHDKIKGLLKAIEVKNDCIKIKGDRRICNAARAKDPNDVMIDVQRTELNNQLVEFQTEINKSLAIIREEVQDLRDVNGIKKILKAIPKP